MVVGVRRLRSYKTGEGQGAWRTESKVELFPIKAARELGRWNVIIYPGVWPGFWALFSGQGKAL